MTDLILALDVTEKKSALSIALECAPHLDAIKVGYPLILSQIRIVLSQSRSLMPGFHRLSAMVSLEKMQSRHVSTLRLIMEARVLLSLR
jgi:orotidine-5'-phosphate decarboxylase